MCPMSTALRYVKEPSNFVNYGLLAKFLGHPSKQVADASKFCFNLCREIKLFTINRIQKQNTFSTGFEATEQNSLTGNTTATKVLDLESQTKFQYNVIKVYIDLIL
jgi:hypothetical protein